METMGNRFWNTVLIVIYIATGLWFLRVGYSLVAGTLRFIFKK